MVYGVVRADMNIRTRRDVKKFLEGLSTGSSSLLKNVTGGYHYHTIEAESEEILDDIQNELAEKGFLAKLQDYEPVDFWGEEESNTNVNAIKASVSVFPELTPFKHWKLSMPLFCLTYTSSQYSPLLSTYVPYQRQV